MKCNGFDIDGVFSGTASAGNVNFQKVSGFGTIDENDGTYIYLDGQGEGRFIATDETTGKTVSAVDNAVTSTAQSKLGSSSALFDGTDDRLTVPSDSDWNAGPLVAADATYNNLQPLGYINGVQTLADVYDTLIDPIIQDIEGGGMGIFRLATSSPGGDCGACCNPAAARSLTSSRLASAGTSPSRCDAVSATSKTDQRFTPSLAIVRGFFVAAAARGRRHVHH